AEEELFGELEWETDTPLDFVVGQGHVHLDDVPAPPAPAPPSAGAPAAALRAPTSAPIDFGDIHIEDAAEDPGQLRGGPEADAWRETERSDPWKATPLPPVPSGGLPQAGLPGPKTPPRAAPPAIPPATPRPAPRAGSPTPVPTAAAAPSEPCGACGGKLVDA